MIIGFFCATIQAAIFTFRQSGKSPNIFGEIEQ